VLSVVVSIVVALGALSLAPAPARAAGATTYLCQTPGDKPQLTHPISVVVDPTLGVLVAGTPLASTVDPATATLDAVVADVVGVVDGMLGGLLGPLAFILKPIFALLSPSANPAEGVVNSLVCTVDGATTPVTIPLVSLLSNVLAGVAPDTGGTPGGTGGTGTGGNLGGTGTGSGGTGSVANPAYNLCTLAIAAKAGARKTKLSITPRKKRFPASRSGVVTIKASYKASGRTRKAKGQVLLCDGTTYLGYVTLKKGTSLVRLPKLAAGRHRLLARYVGSDQARPRDRRVVLKVLG